MFCFILLSTLGCTCVWKVLYELNWIELNWIITVPFQSHHHVSTRLRAGLWVNAKWLFRLIILFFQSFCLIWSVGLLGIIVTVAWPSFSLDLAVKLSHLTLENDCIQRSSWSAAQTSECKTHPDHHPSTTMLGMRCLCYAVFCLGVCQMWLCELQPNISTLTSYKPKDIVPNFVVRPDETLQT